MSLVLSPPLAASENFFHLPRIIQGGMGIAISDWHLARTVSRAGQLGVISGTALPTVLSRRLQLGDPTGKMRHALSHFPVPEMAARILKKYFISGGKPAAQPFLLPPLATIPSPASLLELTVVANFVETFLAKHGHTGLVGLNLLEKIQMPTLPSLFGAILAGVDYVLMGAGIPRSIPRVLDQLARGESTELKTQITGDGPESQTTLRFDPSPYFDGEIPALKRPRFLAVIASATLALTLARKSEGQVDGFVVEGPAAGGHNAPPRGTSPLNASGEPVYGPRDEVDLNKIAQLGLPFWLAGSFGRPGKLAEALRLGAVGIQAGTAFAFCRESGLDPELKRKTLAQSQSGQAHVVTDPFASPTGFPLKVVQQKDTVSEEAAYERRTRICDLGFLRQPYRKADGALGYRCPAEPVEDYVRKGGRREDTVGRKCVCNGLMATAGFAQTHPERGTEPALITAGEDVRFVARFLRPGRLTYSACDVIRQLLRSTPEPPWPAPLG